MNAPPCVPAHGMPAPIPGRERGFTMVEILVVMVIIAIIASIAIPNVRNSMGRTRNPQNAVSGNAVWAAIQSYRLEHHGNFPRPDMVAGTNGSQLKDPAGNKYVKTWPQVNDSPLEVVAETVDPSQIDARVTSFVSTASNANRALYIVTTDRLGARFVVAKNRPDGDPVFAAQVLPTLTFASP